MVMRMTEPPRRVRRLPHPFGKPAGEAPLANVAVRLEPADVEYLNQRAADAGVSRTQIVREAIADHRKKSARKGTRK